MGRVVITGVGAVSALGNDWQEAKKSLEACRNKVRRMDAWEDYAGLFTKLAAPVGDFALASGLTRKKRRTMGRVSLMAVSATERALSSAGLLGDPLLKQGHPLEVTDHEAGFLQFVERHRPPLVLQAAPYDFSRLLCQLL